jgi:uncharacterized protein YbbC (DUF1343 family)
MRSITKNTRPAAACLFALALVAASAGCSREQQSSQDTAPAVRSVKPGVEAFLERHSGLVKGKRVGLITNPTGVDRALKSDVELFLERPEFKLTALYGPEHGVRGDAQAGEHVPFYRDPAYGLPVFSLYGETMKPAAGMIKNIDAYMRSFDTTGHGKQLGQEAVRDIDVMIFDIQDVGTRVYTYVATMAYAMQSCAEAGVPFIVLDRPNPIGGAALEGPVLEYPGHSSFIGVYPIPLRHGLTVGELAMLFNDRFLEKKVFLTVIPAEGWERGRYFDETGLPWLMPSPNMPTLDTAIAYPGQVAFEGTNVSEGRGTTRPFELFGAPWIDGHILASKLNGLGLPGVAFREAWFSPTFSKFQGERCGGCQLHVLDRRTYRPVETTLAVIKTIRDDYPQKFQFHADYFDKVMGNSQVREALESGLAVKDIAAAWEPGLRKFEELRKPYLLYK